MSKAEENPIHAKDAEQAPVEGMSLEEAAKVWREDLATVARADAVIARERSVRLSSTHPGGLAALYADTPIRLSNLVRESTARHDVERQIEALKVFADELRSVHGTVTIYLSVGSASWGGPRPARDVPVFMRQVAIGRDEDGLLTLQLLPGVDISARVLGEIARHGAVVDQDRLVDALEGVRGFSPATALDVIRGVGAIVPDFELHDDIALGLLSHPTSLIYRDLRDDDFLGESPLVRAVVGEPSVRASFAIEPPPPNPYDRDPWKEAGLGDQAPEIQDVVEAASSDASFVIVPTSGADVVGTVVSTAGALAAEGKRVLIILNEDGVSETLAQRFHEVGVSEIVANFATPDSGASAARRLEEAMRDASPRINSNQVEALRASLRRVREELSEYEVQLHAKFPEWEVSPFEALQVLTKLTSDPAGPKTTVRIGREALSAISADDGEHALALLHEASRQGIIVEHDGPTPWKDVILSDSAHAERVLGAVELLANDLLPAVRIQMATVAGQTGLRAATTLTGWAAQLDLIRRARTILETFRPEVFDYSPADMVVATASTEWRRQKGIHLKGSRRRQLVRQARDLLRPGVHVRDLHASLIDVHECRQMWSTTSVEGDPRPVIPQGLDTCLDTLAATQVQIAVVRPYLEDLFGDLETMPFDELCPLMESLAADPDGARLIPGRLHISQELTDMGLGELVADFRVRGIEGDQINAELDLCWWASALSFMLADEPGLAEFDADHLQKTLTSSRLLDRAQVKSLGVMLVERVRTRRREALTLHPEQYIDLMTALEDDLPTPPLFGEYSLAWNMLPIVCAGPALVPQLARRRHSVDTVIAVGMSDLRLAEIIPVVARARNVVIFPLKASDVKSTWVQGFARALPSLDLPAKVVAIDGHIADLVARHKPDSSLIAVPVTHLRSALEYVKVDGSGLPVPGKQAVESSLAEAEAVSDYVATHLATQPDESIAVVTFGKRHAERIKATLRRRVVADSQLRDLVEESGGIDALVVSPRELASVCPDRVVLAVGYSKTPHGKVIHDFGVLSTPEGIDVVEEIAKGVRGELTVITSLSSEEIDRERLTTPGARALADLLALAEGEESILSSLAADDQVEPDDLLVDLAERLRHQGLRVVANLGSRSGIHIPLAVGHPDIPDELLVAVLIDDPLYLSQDSQRVRDRYRPELLEDHGWKVRTELSMTVFIDPNREAQRIADLVTAAAAERGAEARES